MPKSLRLNQTTKSLLIIVFLSIIALYTFFIRSSSLFETYVNADDPYLVYRLTHYFVENYSLPQNDTLRLYPYGWQYYKTRDHLIWYYTAGVLALFFDKVLLLPNSVALAVHFYPPFFAFLTAFAIFFLTKEIFNDWKTALIASLIFASMPAIIYRTNSSFADKEPIASLFMVISYYFYFKALKSKNRKSYYYSILSGLFLALMAMTWGGAELVIASYTLFALLALILGLMNKELAIKHSITSLLAYGIILLGVAGYFKWYAPNNLLNYAIIISVLLASFKEFKKVPKIFNNYYLSVFIIFTALIFLTSFSISESVRKLTLNIISQLREPLAKSGVVASTVAENQPSSYIELARQTGPIFGLRYLAMPNSLALVTNYFFFSIIAMIVLLYKFPERKDTITLLFLSWFIVFVWAGIGAVRLVYIAGYPIAIAAAFVLAKAIDFIPQVLQTKKNLLQILVVSAVIFVLFINAYSGFVFGSSLRPGMSKNWENALLWIKENSNESDVVLSWWDYGYIIQYYAERPTYVDPGHPSYLFGKDKTLLPGVKSRDQLVAKFFTSTNETEYLEWLKSINVRYIVHDFSMIGKYSAVSTIASDGQYTDFLQIFPYQGSTCLEQVNNTCTKVVNRYGPIWVVLTNQTVQPIFISQNIPVNISKWCTPNGIIELDPNGMPGCVAIYSDAVAYLGIRCYASGSCEPYDLGNTIFAQMWFLDAQTLKHFRKVYDNGEVKVFEVIY